ncbi:glycosyltransferase family 4 protein [Nocardioides lentus]|uniref:Glycosyltransferase family 4 protein n=1 Tax=Nocardioides lentus TaxID=338077 RepID=A0ABN2P9F3_9ACTN
MPENRRVLVLNHFAVGAGQAGGTRHVELFGRLTGWDHLIVAADLNPQTGERMTSEPGLTLVPVPTFSSNGPRRVVNWAAYAGRAFVTGMGQEDVDLVYGSSPHLLAAAAAWGVSFLKRKPFVMEVRDLWPQVLVDMGSLDEQSTIYRALSALESFLYSRAAAIVTMAEGTEESLLSRGLPESKIKFIPNGADRHEPVGAFERQELRATYKFTRFTAVYTGAHGPANNLAALLDAARQLGSEEIDLVLVGGGLEKEQLIRRATDDGLTNVRFMDPVPKSEMPALLAAADLGLHILADVDLFQTAISPNKVFDYMAAGLPVLTNNRGRIGDLVASSAAGWSCPTADLAEGIKKVSAMTARERNQVGESGARWLESNQSRTMMADRLRSVLQSLV